MFVRLHKTITDGRPINADGRPLPEVEGTRGKVETRLAQGPLLLVRFETIVAVVPDRKRPDGAWTSLLHRAEGATLQVWESAEEFERACNRSA